MEEKEPLKARAETLEKSHRWMAFRRDQKQALKLRGDKQAKEQELEAAGVTVRPYTERAEKFRGLIKSTAVVVRDGQALWDKGRAKLEACAAKVEPASDDVRNAVMAVEAIEQRRAQKEKERVKVQTELQRALNLPPVNVEELKGKISKVTQLGREAKRAQDDKARVVGRLKQDLHEASKEVYEAEQKKNNEEKQENQRFMRLRNARFFPGARAACELHEWVQRNGGLFTAMVYGPLILEMSVEDGGVAAMVEAQCVKHALLTFAVENDEDRRVLFEEVKRRNAKITIQQLRKYFWGKGGGGRRRMIACLASHSFWVRRRHLYIYLLI